MEKISVLIAALILGITIGGRDKAATDNANTPEVSESATAREAFTEPYPYDQTLKLTISAGKPDFTFDIGGGR